MKKSNWKKPWDMVLFETLVIIGSLVIFGEIVWGIYKLCF